MFALYFVWVCQHGLYLSRRFFRIVGFFPEMLRRSNGTRPRMRRSRQLSEGYQENVHIYRVVPLPSNIKGKILVHLGGYPSSCSQNITPYCPIQPLYNPYLGGIRIPINQPVRWNVTRFFFVAHLETNMFGTLNNHCFDGWKW